MIPDIPWYITTLVISGNIAIALGLWRIVAAANRQPAIRAGAGLFLGGWLTAALLLAPRAESLLHQDRYYYLTPLIPLFALVPTAILLLAVRFSSALRQALARVSLPAIHGIQLYRVIGAVFVFLLGRGQLPAHFAVPAGWGDVVIGLAAPLVAFALARRVSGAPALALSWNVLGLLDLIVAVGMGTGFLAPYLAPELGARVPPAPAMGVFPLVLVPLFAVPISVLLHVLSLARLAAGRRPAARPIAGHAG
jgi:hypothetical protein